MGQKYYLGSSSQEGLGESGALPVEYWLTWRTQQVGLISNIRAICDTNQLTVKEGSVTVKM